MNAPGGGWDLAAAWYDLLAPPTWARHCSDLIIEVATQAEATSILDIGAGTGTVALPVAQALPSDVSHHLLEPDPAMRTALLARLADRPELHARVTVSPGTPATLEGAPVDLIVLTGVITSIPPSQRPSLWRSIAAQLRPGGVVVIVGLDPQKPTAGGGIDRAAGHTEPSSIQLGQHRHQLVYEEHACGPDASELTMTYQTWRGQELVNSQSSTSTRWAAPLGIVVAELAAAGLRAAEVRDLAGTTALFTQRRPR